MPELRELLTELGYGDVRTLLQSGNVVFTSRLGARRLEAELRGQIAEALGVDTPVIVRTRDELAAVVEGDPFGAEAHDPKLYQVTFLSEEPSADAARELAEADVVPERIELIGREVYTWHADGIQRSKVDRLRTSRRMPDGTARNWSTVTALLELADE